MSPSEQPQQPQPQHAAEARGINVRAIAEGKQVHEDDVAGLVIVCEPDLPKMMGSLHPCGSLYERPVNLEQAKSQHAAFRKVVESSGARVLTVREILKHGTERDVRSRIDLEDLAGECLVYELGDCGDDARRERANGGRAGASGGGDANGKVDRTSLDYAVSEEYKRSVLESVAADQLIDIVLTRPKVTIVESYRDTGFSAEYSFSPLTNLVFTRDQQIVTSRGIVMGNLRSAQRKGEVKVMRFCFEKLGMSIAGEVEAPGFLEGGDFFPAGDDLCFIGIGMRSNIEAVLQLLSKDLFGTKRVAVVVDKYDQSQDRMHLDCVFSILGRDVALLYEHAIGPDAEHRRVVHEFTYGLVDNEWDGSVPDFESTKWSNVYVGKYRISQRCVPFDRYLAENGYKVISVNKEQQLKYGCNCLNLGNSHIVCVNDKTARDIARDENFSGLIEHIDFSAITSMYGAVHCGSQVLFRE